MQRSDFNQFANMLMALEGGRLSAVSRYSTLRDAFDEHREAGCQRRSDESASSLYGLTLSQYQRHLKEFFGRTDVQAVGADTLFRISYDQWSMAVQRTCWLPLWAEKMPYQQVSNVMADCALFYNDVPFVFGQLQTIMEQMRTEYKPQLAPVPVAAEPDNATTRRLYVTLCSKPRAAEFIERIIQYRLSYIDNIVDLGCNAEEREKMVERTERLRNFNAM